MSAPVYLLRKNNDEGPRLMNQHKLVTHMASGKLILPPDFPNVDDSRTKFKVLDAACGGAAFLTEVGRKYPNAELYGCDISSKLFPFEYDEGKHPSNEDIVGELELDPINGEAKKTVTLHLRIQDLTSKEGLPVEWNEKFDLIHLRYILVWIKLEDWKQVIENLTKVLKPGGWIQFTEPYFDKTHKRENQPLLNQFLRYLSWVLCERFGSTSDRTAKIPEILLGSEYGPSTVHHHSTPLAAGPLVKELDPTADDFIRNASHEHWDTLVNMSAHRFYAKDENDTWVSALDGAKEKFPVDDKGWDEFTTTIKEQLRTIGLQYPLWFIYGQKKA